MDESLKRKHFIAALAAAGAAAAVEAEPAFARTEPAATIAAAPSKPHPAPAHAERYAPLGNRPEAYAFFTAPEAAFVEAAVARLIPADALGPGAKEAGVAYFIDQQLNGQFGYAAKMYMGGPWLPGTKTQGYQLPLTPREVYRLGIGECDAACLKQHGKSFAGLPGSVQDAVLGDMEHGKLQFDSVPATTFFEMLYGNTVEGFFADPMYGGNRDKIGWKLVGFPGVAAAYLPFIEKHNVPYKVDPVGIADVEQQTGLRDEHHQLVFDLLRGRRPEA